MGTHDATDKLMGKAGETDEESTRNAVWGRGRAFRGVKIEPRQNVVKMNNPEW
jgi:hypothetical protein